MRERNRRLTRKTLGFSKKKKLDKNTQIKNVLYFRERIEIKR